MELRALLGSMPQEELAIAGHAIALGQWHAVIFRFDIPLAIYYAREQNCLAVSPLGTEDNTRGRTLV